jgi:carbon storage regulator CsrA
MLVLGRQIDQSILIGKDVVIRVVSIHGNHVHLGIDAPKDVEILRPDAIVRTRILTAAADGKLAKCEKDLDDAEQLAQI